MKKIKNYLNTILNFGVNATNDVVINKKTKLMNWVMVLLIVNIFLSLALDVYLGFWLNLLIGKIPLILYSFLVIFLNKKGYVEFGKKTFNFVLTSIITICSLLSFHFIAYLVIISLSPIFFGTEKDKKHIIINAVFSLCMIVLVASFPYLGLTPYYKLSLFNDFIIKIVSYFCSFFTLIASIFFFFQENLKAENKLKTISDEIQLEKTKIDYLFNKIDLAVFILNKNGTISEKYAPFSEVLFEKNHNYYIENNNWVSFFQEFDLSSDKKDIISQVLNLSFDEDMIQWDLNSTALPLVLVYKNKFLSINWQPILVNGLVDSILFTAKDISKEIKKEKEENKEKMQNEIMQAILVKGINRITDLIEGTLTKINNFQLNNEKHFIYFLHTLKGETRTLNLFMLSHEIHTIESEIKSLKDQNMLDTIKLSEKINYILSLFMDVFEVINKFNNKTEKNLEVSGLRSLSSLNYYCLEVLESLLKDKNLELDSFFIHDSVPYYSKHQLDEMRQVLLHLITNAVDHGYYYPLIDGKTDVKKVRLQLKATLDKDNLIKICFYDHGFGISDESLQKMIGKLSEKERKNLKNDLDVIFYSGVSSVDTITETSGRGIGMVAIKTIIEDLKGSIQVNKAPKGLEFCFKLPYLK